MPIARRTRIEAGSHHHVTRSRTEELHSPGDGACLGITERHARAIAPDLWRRVLTDYIGEARFFGAF
jgi:hypothetical protein